jgi:hypothetical protein
MAKKPKPRRSGSTAGSARRAAARGSAPKARRGSASPGAALADLKAVATARQVFWSNVMREILVSLCVASARQAQHAATSGASLVPAGAEDPSKIFDGRLAVITSWGLRLSLAAIEPVLGSAPSGGKTPMQQAIECTVFQLRTTDGDVWTLPLHEIRAFHALTEELMQELARAAGAEEGGEEESQPFGFKAFTSLSRMQPSPASELHQPDYLGE